MPDRPPSTPFSHVHAPKADLYRRVMGVFLHAKRRFLVHLRPEDIEEALRGQGQPAEPAEVAHALESLEAWGNLRADPDTSRVTTVDDFYRTRYLYQFTREGEAAERALAEYDRALGQRAELQSVALEDIRIRLHALRREAETQDPDAAVVHGLLRDLAALFDGMAANASAFMSSLQRTIDLHDVDEEAFIAYKDRLIGYLERFIGDLVVKSPEVRETVLTLEEHGIERLLELAGDREAADVAPGEDDKDDVEAARARKRAEWVDRWSGLRSWFVGDSSHPSQAALLRHRARAAIPALLATVATLQERRAGRSDRSADFRSLALWFLEAPSEADAHRLWRAAFGLTPSRHLGIDAATIQARAEEPVPATTSWAAAPPVVIHPRLHATGHHQHRGTLARVVDRSEERRRLAAHLEAERDQLDSVRRRLATGRPVRLRDLGALDRGEFALFLQLLADALSAGPPTPRGIETVSLDGTLAIRLQPLHDGAEAEIQTPDGVLRGPDHLITISDVRAAPSEQAVAAR
jgi:uncharacterized protein (TIGR02677 family)